MDNQFWKLPEPYSIDDLMESEEQEGSPDKKGEEQA